MNEHDDNNSDFLLNSKNLKLTACISLIIANLLFAGLYPEHALVGIIGALFFSLMLLFPKFRTWASERKSDCPHAQHPLKHNPAEASADRK